jgi:hypothetical protein
MKNKSFTVPVTFDTRAQATALYNFLTTVMDNPEFDEINSDLMDAISCLEHELYTHLPEQQALYAPLRKRLGL